MTTRREVLLGGLASAMLPQVSVTPRSLAALAAPSAAAPSVYPSALLLQQLMDRHLSLTVALQMGRYRPDVATTLIERHSMFTLGNVAAQMGRVHAVFDALCAHPDATEQTKRAIRGYSSDGFGDDEWLDDYYRIFDGWPHEGGAEKIAELRATFAKEKEDLFALVDAKLPPADAETIKKSYADSVEQLTTELPGAYKERTAAVKKRFLDGLRFGLEHDYLSVQLGQAGQGVRIGIRFNDAHPMEASTYMIKLPPENGQDSDYNMRHSAYESLNMPLTTMRDLDLIHAHSDALYPEKGEARVSPEKFQTFMKDHCAAFFAENKSGTHVAKHHAWKKEDTYSYHPHEQIVITSNEPLMVDLARDIARMVSEQRLQQRLGSLLDRFSSISVSPVQSAASVDAAVASPQAVTYRIAFTPPSGHEQIVEFDTMLKKLREQAQGVQEIFAEHGMGDQVKWDERSKSLTLTLEPQQAPELQARLDDWMQKTTAIEGR